MNQRENALLRSYLLSLGPSFKQWRLLRGIKQSHAAQLIGVGQSTISRWENDELALDEKHYAAVMDLLSARLSSAQDAALARLIRSSSKPMHLVCDLTHTLLAFSASRGVEFGPDAHALLGHSLWRYATEEIVEAEAHVRRQGWSAQNASVQFCTGHNHSTIVPIYDSVCTWTRLTLSDGTVARLVETECAPTGECATHIVCVDEN
ncbi:helix-turn-helix transcriptional regulator [Pseudomonas sp.]|uniref:helix-turn-helix domain-containing protein n=1 Tax=Pseudomonas sp. TaxID=306 RepID=UPI0028A8B4EC|nr:helix-turn-helix transcriptional regulator [Pseudomonas sp.]